nr:hypothetical protein Iba_chr11fCG13460 [Ipomoea batatas]
MTATGWQSPFKVRPLKFKDGTIWGPPTTIIHQERNHISYSSAGGSQPKTTSRQARGSQYYYEPVRRDLQPQYDPQEDRRTLVWTMGNSCSRRNNVVVVDIKDQRQLCLLLGVCSDIGSGKNNQNQNCIFLFSLFQLGQSWRMRRKMKKVMRRKHELSARSGAGDPPAILLSKQVLAQLAAMQLQCWASPFRGGALKFKDGQFLETAVGRLEDTKRGTLLTRTWLRGQFPDPARSTTMIPAGGPPHYYDPYRRAITLSIARRRLSSLYYCAARALSTTYDPAEGSQPSMILQEDRSFPIDADKISDACWMEIASLGTRLL